MCCHPSTRRAVFGVVFPSRRSFRRVYLGGGPNWQLQAAARACEFYSGLALRRARPGGRSESHRGFRRGEPDGDQFGWRGFSVAINCGSARTSRTEADACHGCHPAKSVLRRLAGCRSIPRVWVCCEVRVGRPGRNSVREGRVGRPWPNIGSPGPNMANTNLMQHRHLARRSALGQAMGTNGPVGPKTSSRSQTVEIIRPKASYEYS